MNIIQFEDAVEIFNQQGCVGKKILNSQGLELVHLTVGVNSSITKHALPYPVIFHVLEGSGTLVTNNEIITVKAGTTLECPPDVQRGWENSSSKDLKLLVIKCIGESE